MIEVRWPLAKKVLRLVTKDSCNSGVNKRIDVIKIMTRHKLSVIRGRVKVTKGGAIHNLQSSDSDKAVVRAGIRILTWHLFQNIRLAFCSIVPGGWPLWQRAVAQLRFPRAIFDSVIK